MEDKLASRAKTVMNLKMKSALIQTVSALTALISTISARDAEMGSASIAKESAHQTILVHLANT